MSLSVFLAVLAAAFLHASWNALIRSGTAGGSRLQNLLVLALVQGALGVALLCFAPLPPLQIWPWLIAAGALHAGYKLCLSAAYDHGDLSRVYPIARGTAPLLTLLLTVALGIDALKSGPVLAILVLVAGILTMAASALRAGESRRLIPWALATATMTAAYTLVDGIGVRQAGDLWMFLGWTFALDGLFFGLATLALQGPGIFRISRSGWSRGAMAGAASLGSYGVAVWAMTKAPIAMVGALRETSILFAMLMGWLIFHEPMSRDKALAGGLILLGVVLMQVLA
ncbi:DMT family transporter [Xinfangfangia sp. CPCC 101601]|uniref:DMT family transporter n=1 Tax=Pseudogemmobacter lacusdianii TaxID=3069608 RepID=A0ABU0VWE9_9RHOB|nr:DMT family transporter [Xinfangfangia sp. CPCC 101601]MDQ2066081.1 DMT family transporter [Xinfangfangia sp. CPCC 101601]